MKIKNIETSYGKFPTMIHYEKYWKGKVKQEREKILKIINKFRKYTPTIIDELIDEIKQSNNSGGKDGSKS